MAFSFQTLGLFRNPTGVFFVKLPFTLKRPPIRSAVFVPISDVLNSRTGRDAGKNAGGNRSAKAGVVLVRHIRANRVYCNHFTSWDAFH